MTEENILRIKYMTGDMISVILSYCFVFFVLLERNIPLPSIVLLCVIHLFVYTLSGYYNKPFAKSRIKEFLTTAFSVPFAFALSMIPLSVSGIIQGLGYSLYLSLILINYVTIYFCRLAITQTEIIRDRNGLRKINVFIVSNGLIGDNTKKWIQKYKNKNIVGEVDFNRDISEIITLFEESKKNQTIKELVIASDSNSLDKLNEIISHFLIYGLDIYTSAKGFAKVNMRNNIDTLFGEPIVEITKTNISEAGKNIKWVSDKIISLSLLIILSPLFLILAIIVRLDSDGEVFFRQERIGLNGKPFYMYKFRSMYVNSEGDIPLLSHKGDKRITKCGRWMRKYRLDELPQLYNVLKGDMAIVGPRPEREFYIKQLVQHRQNYILLQKIKPGITSWGIVRYGYASNIKEMLERFDYDWIYYQNMSVILDLTVMLYTIRTLILGVGK